MTPDPTPEPLDVATLTGACEQALGDRSRNVRATAAELLSALPDSALAARMADRAASCVALDRTAGRPELTVEAPHECDAGMERDGVAPKPPAGRPISARRS